ncbi:MAG TPA: S9 family peptidase [Candidatus Acidoferrales bacterium]|jgi:dipeptidyl-peptidase-4|nr:S9 family peptidase [Candidatus Acidoferrales bacterium]
MLHLGRRSLGLLFGISLVLLGALPARPQTAAQSKPLTVERIFSFPSLSGSSTRGLEWSPDSKRLTYLHRSGKGADAKMELLVMDASTGETRVLVPGDKLGSLLPPPKGKPSQATGLGRRPPESYFWAPDGNALLFAGGGDLVWLNLKTMEATPLVHGESDVQDPKISPDGRWVSYLQDYNLWVVGIDKPQPKQLTRGGNEDILEGQLDWVYPEELDLGTAYWWAPDSSHLAFLEMDERPVTKYPIVNLDTGAVETTRYPQAGEANPVVRVGVVGVEGGKTRWIDTGSNNDVYLARVTWLPDGQRLAIQRLNRGQDRLDLLLADASTGSSQTILTEQDPHWINVTDDLHFFSDGTRFLWTSERTGYRHIYLYDISGRQLDQLTSGDWEVTGSRGFGPGSDNGLAVDEGRGYAYFFSNKDNITETQFYRLSLRDKSITRLTKEAGSHFAVIAPDASAYVDIYSNSMTPSRQDLFRADGSRIAVINENKVPELAEYQLSPVEFMKVPADDGTSLQAAMIKPPGFDPAHKYPVLIAVYGGPHAQVVRNAWGGTGFLWHQMMAQKGYIIFSLDNRGSFGRGHAFETPLYRHFGKIELADQLAGVKYLKSQPYVDGSRIGIFGWSYGGYMTLTALFDAPDAFKAGVAGAPVTDWRLYDTIYTERYMGRPQDNADGYKDSSPVTHAARLKAHLMEIHGTGDDNVHFANTAELLNELIEAGKYPDVLMVFPGRGHGASDPPAQKVLYERITRFLLASL